MLSLGRPSKPDDKALGRDSGGALLWNVVAFTSLFQPQSTSSEDGCEPLHRDGQCGLKVISWCSLNLKPNPDHGVKELQPLCACRCRQREVKGASDGWCVRGSEACKGRAELSSMLAHVCARTHTVVQLLL